MQLFDLVHISSSLSHYNSICLFLNLVTSTITAVPRNFSNLTIDFMHEERVTLLVKQVYNFDIFLSIYSNSYYHIKHHLIAWIRLWTGKNHGLIEVQVKQKLSTHLNLIPSHDQFKHMFCTNYQYLNLSIVISQKHSTKHTSQSLKSVTTYQITIINTNNPS